MKKKLALVLCSTLIIGLISTTGCSMAALADNTQHTNQDHPANANQYTLEQAMSDNAQLSTIAFSGLAFITGSSGADTFMPPGKVADFFGFQYMRDVDTAGYGHNTTFLSRVANNVLYILNDEQKAKLVALAKEQAPLYTNFAYNRFPIMNAFRRNLEGDIPEGSSGLDSQVVSKYTGALYKTDADLSYTRALIVGEIINSFTENQKAYLAKMQFNNYLSWPDVAEDDELKKSMDNTEFVAVMTYASELFSWYKGNLDADVYFCPERHGTYFGGFYMKDYPAMNNPDYFISTAITGDSGKEFLNILNSKQRALITGIIDEQRLALAEVTQIRTTVSTELRKAISGETIDKEKVYSLIERYGELDGKMSALYATRFSQVNKTLKDDQRTALVKLRNLNVIPKGAYRFSTLVAMPKIPNTDFMFGIGSLPENAGQIAAPGSFSSSNESCKTGNNADKNGPIKNNYKDKSLPKDNKNKSPKRDDKNKPPKNDNKNKTSKTQKDEVAKKIKNSKVVFNGKELDMDTPPIIKNGRTLIPLRSIVEHFGAKVQWDSNNQTVKIIKGDTIINLTVGKKNAKVNGTTVELETPAEIANGRTLVPARFISEAFDLKVGWDQDTMTTTIDDK